MPHRQQILPRCVFEDTYGRRCRQRGLGNPPFCQPHFELLYEDPRDRWEPDADPFVAVGSKVSESSVVCLVEAMKVFNEIKADTRGTITEILVSDGDSVEYGQPLFRVISD